MSHADRWFAWQELRKQVAAANYLANGAVFDRARDLFLDDYAKAGSSPGELTREYEREEFLLVVDEQGAAPEITTRMLKSYQETIAAYPEFVRWFRVTHLPGDAHLPGDHLPGGAQVLMAARWLCHLVGLRHGTVEIFIDPPHLDGHTLIQVRGLEKFEAPGAFDIPCAGHISGSDTAEESLRKELAEELNLSLDNLSDLRLIQRYNSYTGTSGGVSISINNEYRVLYRARLRSEAAGSIRFTDGEVAGLAVFSVPELRAMVAQYPDRIASGLGDAMGFYIQ